MISSPAPTLRTLLSHEQGRLAALEKLQATDPDVQDLLERLIQSRRSQLNKLEALLRGELPGPMPTEPGPDGSPSPLWSAPSVPSAHAGTLPEDPTKAGSSPTSLSTSLPTLKAGQARLEATRPLTPTAQELTFASGRPFDFLPGQHVKMRVPVEGSIVNRDYSIARCLPDMGRFTLWIKRVPGGGASQAICDLPAGSILDFSGPTGSFVLSPPESALARVAFVATGTGLAPLAAMLEALLNTRQFRGPVELLWGLRTEEDVFFEDELNALRVAHPNLSFTIALSEPTAGSSRHPGRVTSLLAAWPGRQFQGTSFYLAGNGMMIDEVITLLTGRGVPSNHIHTEAFFKR